MPDVTDEKIREEVAALTFDELFIEIYRTGKVIQTLQARKLELELLFHERIGWKWGK